MADAGRILEQLREEIDELRSEVARLAEAQQHAPAIEFVSGSIVSHGTGLYELHDPGRYGSAMSKEIGWLEGWPQVQHAVERKILIEQAATAAAEEAPMKDLATSSAELGAPVGRRLDIRDATLVLLKIAYSASDLFSSTEEAQQHIDQMEFPEGSTALRLIMEGRAATVLARLDELRLGTQG